MLLRVETNFMSLARELRDALLEAPLVEVGEWHSQRGAAGATTAELEDISIALALPTHRDALADLVQPNRAWADEHFAERVGGIPYNPPPSHTRWPHAQRDNELHRAGELFSHSYPERLWPRFVGDGNEENRGLRFRYGDLDDAVRLLAERRATRQAYIPIWFPEDGAAALEGQRVPCTLGYHAMIRDDRLTLRYFMRSCDFIRHFRDDVYLAGCLAQWLCEQLNGRGNEPLVAPRALVMHVSSLHVFAPSDLQVLRYNQQRGRVW